MPLPDDGVDIEIRPATKKNKKNKKNKKKMDKQEEVNRVQELGSKIGYGHLMCIASALWRKSLKESGYPAIGAFVPTALPFIEKEIAESTKSERELYDKLVSTNRH
jgi:hypothetical protein